MTTISTKYCHEDIFKRVIGFSEGCPNIVRRKICSKGKLFTSQVSGQNDDSEVDKISKGCHRIFFFFFFISFYLDWLGLGALQFSWPFQYTCTIRKTWMTSYKRDEVLSNSNNQLKFMWVLSPSQSWVDCFDQSDHKSLRCEYSAAGSRLKFFRLNRWAS